MERVEKRNAKIEEVKKSMACVPVEHGLLADTLMAAESALAADQFKALESALRGLSEVAKSSALFKETGTLGGEGGDAEARLLSIAKSIQEKTPSMTFNKALVAAAEQNPELYQEQRGAK